MNVLTVVASIAVAAVLLSAALAKLAEPRAIEETIRRLGFGGIARGAALLLIAGETAVGAGLLFRPDAASTQLGLLVLAGAFAAAGIIALARREAIPCSCFGSAARPLGRQQLIAFVPLAATAALLRLFVHDAPPLPTGAVLFACVSLAIAARAAASAALELRQSRSDRRSAQESYLWL